MIRLILFALRNHITDQSSIVFNGFKYSFNTKISCVRVTAYGIKGVIIVI